jgi:sigma-E factor negative regulatory protein RseA
MKSERAKDISALFDGELEEHEVRAAIQASLNDPGSWRLYGLIGDGLRGEPVDVPDMTASVMSRIGDEPVVLAPRNLKTRQRHHPLLALAASVAGVAVVGWVALTGNPQSPAAEQYLAAAQKGKVEIAGAVLPAPTFLPPHARNPGSLPPTGGMSAGGGPAPTFVNPPQAGMQGDMNEYLLAHHAQAATARLGDSTKQIRTVSMSSARP